ncbi:hypothetical protein AGMMS50249_6750 [candidate division SR1 bacterium]|nr:hypothetical protein AGMMS50249_6750 [candidate division SR1 bacterium]
MLPEIKSLIETHVALSSKDGLFFSLFDKDNNLLASQGTITTDKTLESLVDLFYQGIISKFEKQTKTVVLDLVDSIQTVVDIQAFLSFSPVENGVILTSTTDKKTGILLPNTAGITTMQDALSAIKAKDSLSGNVEISTFKTTRLVLLV